MTTLGDLKEHFHIYGVCRRCRRTAALSMELLLEEFGRRATIADIRAHLRCRVCNERSNELRIVYVGPCRNATYFQYRPVPPPQKDDAE